MANATELIGLLPNNSDPVNMDQYSALSRTEFTKAMVSGNVLCYVYSFDLMIDSSSKVACPTETYLETAASISKQFIALFNQLLAVIFCRPQTNCARSAS